MEATKPTPPAHRDPEYLQHVRSHDCKRCGKGEGVQAAHVGGLEAGKGWSRKVSDLRCIPLCLECHGMLDRSEWRPNLVLLETWIAELLFEYVGLSEVIPQGATPEARRRLRFLCDPKRRAGWGN